MFDLTDRSMKLLLVLLHDAVCSIRLQVSRPHSAFSPVPFTPPFTGKCTCVCVCVSVCVCVCIGNDASVMVINHL